MNLHEALKSVDFKSGLNDNEMISDAVVLMRVTNMETGLTFMAVRHSTGADSITVTGLLYAACRVDDRGWEEVDGDENE